MRLGYYPIELLFWYDGGWAADAKIAMSCVVATGLGRYAAWGKVGRDWTDVGRP